MPFNIRTLNAEEYHCSLETNKELRELFAKQPVHVLCGGDSRAETSDKGGGAHTISTNKKNRAAAA